jgi:hypothetical protein
MRPPIESPALRRLVLTVAVLDDVDVEPRETGVLLTGDIPVEVPWPELSAAVGHLDLESPVARIRARRHLVGRRLAAGTTPEALQARARPVGFPTDDALHPGRAWVQESVLGGALDLGLGFVGVGEDPDAVVVLPVEGLDAVAASRWWPEARRYLERMGTARAERFLQRPEEPLRPSGDCDVVTLLGSRALRTALAGRDGTGMAAVAVPMRRRGWCDLRRIDPAFAVAAAAATDEELRGFPRPLLVTVEELGLARAGGRPADLPLRDPSPVPRGRLPLATVPRPRRA